MCNLQIKELQVVTNRTSRTLSHKTEFNAPFQSQNKTSRTTLCKNKTQVPRVLKCKNPHTS